MFVGAPFAKADSTDSAQLYQVFRAVCLQRLYQHEDAQAYLAQQGWLQRPMWTFRLNSLFGNFLFHGLQEDRSSIHIAPGGGTAIVMGQEDNDLNPNRRCLLSTLANDARLFENWATATFTGHTVNRRTGQRFGNTRTEWRAKDFPQNISATVPYTSVVLHTGLNASQRTDAVFQFGVVGLIPNG